MNYIFKKLERFVRVKKLGLIFAGIAHKLDAYLYNFHHIGSIFNLIDIKFLLA